MLWKRQAGVYLKRHSSSFAAAHTLRHSSFRFAEHAILKQLIQEHPLSFRLEEESEKCFTSSGDLLAYKNKTSDHISGSAISAFREPDARHDESVLSHVLTWYRRTEQCQSPWISTGLSLP